MDLKAILEKYMAKEILTEEVSTEITTLFEALVTEASTKKIEDAEKVLEATQMKTMEDFKIALVEKLSDYLEKTFTEWADENKPLVIAEAKVAMAENVVSKMKSVLSENFVEIKEEDINPVKDLQTKLEESNTSIVEKSAKIDELTEKEIETAKQIFEYEKAITFSKLTEGMSISEREKLLTLVEDIACNDIKSFTTKVNIIKNKFMTPEVVVVEEEVVIEEDSATVITEEVVGDLDKYLPKNNWI